MNTDPEIGGVLGSRVKVLSPLRGCKEGFGESAKKNR
jgi:hypothetical protein